MNGKTLTILVGLFASGVGFVGGRFTAATTAEQVEPLHQSALRDRNSLVEAAPLAEIGQPQRSRDDMAVNPSTAKTQREKVSTTGESRDEGKFSAALLAHFDTEYRRAWSLTRVSPPADVVVAAGQQEFETRVLALPAILGESGAAQANDTDSAAAAILSGDGIVLVDLFANADTTVDESKLDKEFFERAFIAQSNADVVDAALFAGANPPSLTDGMTVEFTDGIHQFDWRKLMRKDGSFPEDVTIVGAGINSTLVTFDEMHPRNEVKRLRIRDLTYDCGNNYMFDARVGVVTIDLHSVRIVRFDMGAGGSLIFGANKGILIRARGCEFLGGDGRSPGSGSLFRGAAAIASFTGCRFAQLNLSMANPRHTSATFSDCIFERFTEDPTQSESAVFVRSTVLPLITYQQYRDRTLRSLTEWFPAWEH